MITRIRPAGRSESFFRHMHKLIHERKIMATGTVPEILANRDPYVYEFVRASGVAAAGVGVGSPE